MIIKNNLRITILIIIAALSSFPFGCSKKDIEGLTKDPFGKGISGVSVQILKSEFKSTTDGNGKYSLDYVPGTFTIQYSKDGYTTIKLNLAIQQKSKFPAEPIVMYPIPKREGIHYIGDTGLIQLNPVPVLETEQHVRDRSSYSMAKTPQTADVLNIKSGKATFIDNSRHPRHRFPHQRVMIVLVKLGNGNLIMDYSRPAIGAIIYHYVGVIKDNPSHVGEEKLYLRTVDLAPGNYAWCGMFESLTAGSYGDFLPHKELPCFPFIVSQSFSEKK